MISKAARLLTVLPRNPREFVDRVRAGLTSRLEYFSRGRAHSYAPVPFNAAVASLSMALHDDVKERLREPALAQISKECRDALYKLRASAPFATAHNADSLVSRLSYAITRSLRPSVVVECGVCYGISSAHFLQPLAQNGQGKLHSIDLPPSARNADNYVGCAVPSRLRTNWKLYRGTSRRLLKPLLAGLPQLDLFFHDSLHTFANMHFEFESAWTALRPGGILLADDIESNSAFAELALKPDVALSFCMRQTKRDSLFGIAVKQK